MYRKHSYLLAPDAVPGGSAAPGTFAAPVTGLSQDTSDEIDALSGGAPPPAPAPAPAPAAPPPSPAPAAPVNPPTPNNAPANSPSALDDIARLTPKGPAKPAPAAPAAGEPENRTPAQLREAYHRVVAEKEELQRKLQLPPDVDKDPRFKSLAAEREALAKERDKLAGDIRFVDYTKSPEFHEQHVEPINQAFKQASESFTNLELTDPTTGERRPGTQDDAIELIRIANPIARAKRAREMFGDMAAYATDAIRPVIDGFSKRDQAMKTYKEKGAEIEAQRKAQLNEIRGQFETQFDSNLTRVMEEVPELYGRIPETEPDANEYNTNVARITGLTKAAFRKPDEMPVDAWIRVQAAVAARSIGFERMTRNNRVLESEVATLKERLKRYESSEPSMVSGNTGQNTGAPQVGGFEAEIERLVGT